MTRSKDKNWLYIASLTFVVVVIWMGVSAYAQSRKMTIPPDIEKIMAPLDPNINQEIFTKLEKRAK